LWECGKHGCIDTRAHGSECLCFGMDVHKHVSDALCNFNCYAKLEGLNLVALEAVLLNIILILMISLNSFIISIFFHKLYQIVFQNTVEVVQKC
jgi:hypothetical protein